MHQLNKEKISANLTQLIKSAREKCGLDVTSAAKRLQMDPGVIRECEEKSLNVPLCTLIKVIELYRLEAVTLYSILHQ